MTDKRSVQGSAPELLTLWLKDSGRSISSLARDLGVDRKAVTRWATGQHHPGADSSARLELLTGGRVPAANWISGKEAKSLKAAGNG